MFSNDPIMAGERLEMFAQLLAQGLSVAAAGRQLGISERTSWNYKKALKARTTQDALKAQTPPIKPIAPEGFEIRSISSGVDKTGHIEKQWVQATPEANPGETVPDGHLVKGLSTLLDESGNVRAQWVKTKIDESKLARVGEAVVEALRAKVEPLPPTQWDGREVTDELIHLVTMTDCHVGMLAWPAETHDAPWDTSIAERVLVETFCRMIDAAPAAKAIIINQLGDFLHFDSLLAVTPTSGHVLDSDSRYQLVVQAAVRILKRIVLHAMTKFEMVYVYMNEGNHDMAGSVWLRVLFSELFANNPRVKVQLNPNPYQALQWGKTMLGFYHGHLAKKGNLPQVYAAQYAKMWGATEHRFVHTGHYHSIDEKEYPGIIVRQHPTIASSDAYAARLGFLSKRQATLITYHRELGEVARMSFLPHE